MTRTGSSLAKMAALVGATILLGACGGGAAASPPAASEAGATAVEIPAPARPPAPLFDLAALGGGRFILAEHRGEVVVFYSGSLCAT